MDPVNDATLIPDVLRDIMDQYNDAALVPRNELNFSLDWSSPTGHQSDVAAGNLMSLLVDVALGVFMIICCLLTVVGNAMVLHAVRTDRRLQTACNMFIVSLAIADLIVGLFVMPMSAVYVFTVQWNFGVGLCQLWIAVDYTASTASILNLFVLSLDRYWSVTTPLQYLRKRTKRRALVMISIVWAISFLWVIPVVGWHHFVNGGLRNVPPEVCDTEYATNTALKIITSILNYFLPLGAMYVLYAQIFHEIRTRSMLELTNNCLKISTRSSTTVTSLGPEGSTVDSDDRPSGLTPAVHSPVIHRLSYFSRKISLYRSLVRRTHRATEVAIINSSPYTDSLRSAMSLHLKTSTGGERLVGTSESIQSFYNQTAESSVCTDVITSTTLDPSTLKTAPERTVKQLDEGHLEGDTPPSRSRVRFQLDTTECDDYDVITRDRPSSLLPKEPHPSKDQVVRRLQSSQDKRGSYSSAASCRPENYFSVINHGVDTERMSSPLEQEAPRINNSPDRDNSFEPTTNNDERGIRIIPSAASELNTNKRLRGATTINPSPLCRLKPSSALRKEIKAAKQLGVIMGAFTICFLPYFVCFTVVAFCPHCVNAQLMTLVTWVGYLNSTLNPILYPLCNANFRIKLRHMLACTTTCISRSIATSAENSVVRLQCSHADIRSRLYNC